MKEKEEEQKKAEEKHHKKMISKARYKFDPSESGCTTYIFANIIIISVIGFCLNLIVNDINITIIATPFIGFISTISIFLFATNIYPKMKAKKFIEENPDDELIPYIKEAYNIKEKSI